MGRGRTQCAPAASLAGLLEPEAGGRARSKYDGQAKKTTLRARAWRASLLTAAAPEPGQPDLELYSPSPSPVSLTSRPGRKDVGGRRQGGSDRGGGELPEGR